MKFFDKLKSIFSCGSSELKFSWKSKCLSKCCKTTNIEVDIDNDGKTDVELKKVDSDFEIIVHTDIEKDRGKS